MDRNGNLEYFAACAEISRRSGSRAWEFVCDVMGFFHQKNKGDYRSLRIEFRNLDKEDLGVFLFPEEERGRYVGRD